MIEKISSFAITLQNKKEPKILFGFFFFEYFSFLSWLGFLKSEKGRASMVNCFGRLKKRPGHSLTNAPLKETNNNSGGTNVSSKMSHSLALLSGKNSIGSRKDAAKTFSNPRSVEEILSSPHLKPFTHNELKNATRNFRDDNLIGEGGFGYVFKGWLDEQTLGAAKPGSGIVVAIKKLKPEGFQGHKEWLSEVTYLGQLRHPNLVKLIGYCLDGQHRLLVYEYMPRGSLENHLFRRGAQPLSWATRIKVAIGAARGLSFLHDSEQPIIYRDFKASNILLDSEFNSKLSDFGLAKAGPTGDVTHISTQVLGTQGYAAPEYIATGRLTAKCDVYSFGVVLLELLSGRRAVDKTNIGVEQSLVDWARLYLGNKRKLFRIMDTKLEGQYSQRGAFILSVLALQCIGEAKHRPKMSEVLATLEELPALNRRTLSPKPPPTLDQQSISVSSPQPYNSIKV